MVEAALLSYMKAEYAELMSEINRTGNYDDDISSNFKEALDKFLASQTWRRVFPFGEQYGSR